MSDAQGRTWVISLGGLAAVAMVAYLFAGKGRSAPIRVSGVTVLAAMFGLPGMLMVMQFFRWCLDAYREGPRNYTDYLLVLIPLAIGSSFLSVAAYFTQMAVKMARHSRI